MGGAAGAHGIRASCREGLPEVRLIKRERDLRGAAGLDSLSMTFGTGVRGYGTALPAAGLPAGGAENDIEQQGEKEINHQLQKE